MLAILAAFGPASAGDKKLTDEEKIDLLRGLTAEFATAKLMLPRSKSALPFQAGGTIDKEKWDEAFRKNGPAARSGDLVKITKVSIEDDRINLEINEGFKSGRKWWQGVEVGMGGSTSPVGRRDYAPKAGTNLALVFGKKIESLRAAEVKKLLAPVLDFEKRTVTENYVTSLPEPVQKAIKEKKAIEGMNQEQVILSMGKPRHKSRETVDGVDLDDWIYGQPPGKVTFITFQGSKVVKVKESYAGLGGSTAPKLPVQ